MFRRETINENQVLYFSFGSDRMQSVHRWLRTCTIEVTQDNIQARAAPNFLPSSEGIVSMRIWKDDFFFPANTWQDDGSLSHNGVVWIAAVIQTRDVFGFQCDRFTRTFRNRHAKRKRPLCTGLTRHGSGNSIRPNGRQSSANLSHFRYETNKWNKIIEKLPFHCIYYNLRFEHLLIPFLCYWKKFQLFKSFRFVRRSSLEIYLTINDFFPEALKRFKSIDKHDIQKCRKSNFKKKIAEELFGCSNLYVRMICWHLNWIDILTKNIAAGTNELREFRLISLKIDSSNDSTRSVGSLPKRNEIANQFDTWKLNLRADNRQQMR